MRREFCAACSNEVDPASAVRRVRPGGETVYFCTEECRIVGDDIEPPAKWEKTGEYRDDRCGEHGCGARLAPKPKVRKKAAAKR